MPRGRGRRRRQDPVGGGQELRLRRAPREQQPQSVVRNERRRPQAGVDEEAPIVRRQRVDEPQLVALHPDVDMQVNEPQLAALDWTDSFIAYAQVLIERYPGKASELFSYMSIIRGAAADHPFEKWYSYDQQFRLRVSRDHTKKWSSIDVFLWLRILTANNQKQQQANVSYKCYDFNFKGVCNKRNCQYRHACLKCGFDHSASRCRRFMDNEIDTDPSRYNRNDIAPFQNNSANRQNPKGSFNKR
ncbi:Hypothetical predicted protein [Mytilus galloprovincialis]|uniref:C3H1-type domain-containing protein n=1 Tax=Mytilus galloprovincialis TaxID=29158 RepID=A0A8B6CU32_MYTGA|nr:Hypothetical predicted protein [Mytilus galloprovincialis]